MCQTEWESAAEGREAHGSKKLCDYHHPFLTNHPSCSTSTLHKAAFPSAGASALMTVPRYDKAKYPGVEVAAAALKSFARPRPRLTMVVMVVVVVVAEVQKKKRR
jgi:hypothetical protein